MKLLLATLATLLLLGCSTAQKSATAPSRVIAPISSFDSLIAGLQHRYDLDGDPPPDGGGTLPPVPVFYFGPQSINQPMTFSIFVGPYADGIRALKDVIHFSGDLYLISYTAGTIPLQGPNPYLALASHGSQYGGQYEVGVINLGFFCYNTSAGGSWLTITCGGHGGNVYLDDIDLFNTAQNGFQIDGPQAVDCGDQNNSYLLTCINDPLRNSIHLPYLELPIQHN